MAFLRKEGRYYKIYWYQDGKLHKRSARTGNKQIARQILSDIENKLSAQKFNINFINGVFSLSDFLDEALEYSKINKSARTVEIEEQIFKKFKKFCGDININRPDTKLIESFKSYLKSENLEPTTINIYLRHLSSAFSLAVRYKRIPENPFRHVKKLPEQKKQPVFLSREQAEKLMENTKNTYLYDYILTSLYTGARISEICKLKWENVDLENRTIKLMGKGSRERTIPIADRLLSHLKSLEKGEYVMRGTRNRNEVTRQFRKKADEIGLYNFKFHNFRDTFASWLVQKGRTVQEVRILLGHSSITTTMIYAHLAPSNLKEAIDVL